MFRKKYLIIRRGLPLHIPHGVNGRSGMLYGHMTFQKRFNAHVLAIDGALWEAPGGAGQDIMRQLLRSRSSTDYEIFVDVESDPESELARMANALDAAHAEIARLKEEGRHGVANVVDVIDLIQPQDPPAGDTQPEKPMFIGPANEETAAERRARLTGMPFRELRLRALEERDRITPELLAGLKLPEVKLIKTHKDFVTLLNALPS